MSYRLHAKIVQQNNFVIKFKKKINKVNRKGQKFIVKNKSWNNGLLQTIHFIFIILFVLVNDTLELSWAYGDKNKPSIC